ncbi:MAG: SOS response-associated peptidase [Candidatus Shapirobacteria bacterium]|jgi:putative SOS response-associated peptidase YedK
MCGRYLLTPDPDFYSRYSLSAQISLPPTLADFSPGGRGLIVIRNQSQNQLETALWGLIPFWAKDPKIGVKLFNARSETLATKPAFSRSFFRQRCLVPASAFYEWQKSDTGKKVPYLVSLKDNQNFSLAGISATWQDPQGNSVQTYTIITTQPNSLIAPIHHRMPVIISRPDENSYLNPDTSSSQLKKYLKPYPAALLRVEKLTRSSGRD